ncbi:NADH-quinone oxidoreductase subunit A [Raineyella fluvialis]|uniref:NADH-quinone oxidoreductase subunit n=1 Tax=Raineyella fluvialis TaxID=2662261 RepID=A0A5Q2F734_9ACTN|nr:NADH-quinone oxidoreductase subunit A [Raineyella fluvialis]QGF22800.1 NADH-quinone oxidoreductase subunit A [Raineyella fluvialis]
MNMYLPLILMLVMGAVMATVALVSAIIGPSRYNRVKSDSYECGIEPTPQPIGGGRFPVKYYITAMLFIIFDIEVVFLYPWAVSLNNPGLRSFALVQMLIFIGLVFLAYVYEWRRGGLEWD